MRTLMLPAMRKRSLSLTAVAATAATDPSPPADTSNAAAPFSGAPHTTGLPASTTLSSASEAQASCSQSPLSPESSGGVEAWYIARPESEFSEGVRVSREISAQENAVTMPTPPASSRSDTVSPTNTSTVTDCTCMTDTTPSKGVVHTIGPSGDTASQKRKLSTDEDLFGDSAWVSDNEDSHNPKRRKEDDPPSPSPSIDPWSELSTNLADNYNTLQTHTFVLVASLSHPNSHKASKGAAQVTKGPVSMEIVLRPYIVQSFTNKGFWGFPCFTYHRKEWDRLSDVVQTQLMRLVDADTLDDDLRSKSNVLVTRGFDNLDHESYVMAMGQWFPLDFPMCGLEGELLGMSMDRLEQRMAQLALTPAGTFVPDYDMAPVGPIQVERTQHGSGDVTQTFVRDPSRKLKGRKNTRGHKHKPPRRAVQNHSQPQRPFNSGAQAPRAPDRSRGHGDANRQARAYNMHQQRDLRQSPSAHQTGHGHQQGVQYGLPWISDGHVAKPAPMRRNPDFPLMTESIGVNLNGDQSHSTAHTQDAYVRDRRVNFAALTEKLRLRANSSNSKSAVQHDLCAQQPFAHGTIASNIDDAAGSATDVASIKPPLRSTGLTAALETTKLSGSHHGTAQKGAFYTATVPLDPKKSKLSSREL